MHVLYRRFTAPLALSSTRLDDCTTKIQFMFPDDLQTIMASGSRLESVINILARTTERFDPKCHTNTDSWIFVHSFPWFHPTTHSKSPRFFYRSNAAHNSPLTETHGLVWSCHGVMPLDRYLHAEAVPPVVPWIRWPYIYRGCVGYETTNEDGFTRTKVYCS